MTQVESPVLGSRLFMLFAEVESRLRVCVLWLEIKRLEEVTCTSHVANPSISLHVGSRTKLSKTSASRTTTIKPATANTPT